MVILRTLQCSRSSFNYLPISQSTNENSYRNNRLHWQTGRGGRKLAHSLWWVREYSYTVCARLISFEITLIQTISKVISRPEHEYIHIQPTHPTKALLSPLAVQHNVLQYSSGICNPNKPSSFSPSKTSSGIDASRSICAESTEKEEFKNRAVRSVRFQNFHIGFGLFGMKEPRLGIGFGPFKTGIFK